MPVLDFNQKIAYLEPKIRPILHWLFCRAAVLKHSEIPAIFLPVAALGRKSLNILANLGRAGMFMGLAIRHIFAFPFRVGRIVREIYFIGVKSLTVITLTALFTGMVLGLQGYYTLVKFGSTGMLGAAVALSIIRELGPVLTAIMVTARAGSAMAAELGIMRISEQIDALYTMGINPIRFLVSPKVAASLLCFPILTAYFDLVGIFGGYLTGVGMLDMNSGVYLNRIELSVEMKDVSGGFIKSIVFALLVSTTCCCQGFYTHLRKEGFGAKGVSLSTTSAVVASCVIILMADYVLTSFFM